MMYPFLYLIKSRPFSGLGNTNLFFREYVKPECPKQKAHNKQPTPNEFFNSARCKLEGSHCHKSDSLDSLDSLDSHRLAEDDGDHPSVCKPLK
jgi:hypothetical protein